jgi:cytochrome c oxidase subunit I
VKRNKLLCLAHLWTAFGLFAPAILLGAWQMLERSPLPAPFDNPSAYYASVTAHGTTMAYVITTFFAMGMGYAIAETTLDQAMQGTRLAWTGFVMCWIGTIMAIATVLAGKASVLYTFYPPLTGSPIYYLGVLIIVLGSWIWCYLMVANMLGYKERHGSEYPVPLAMFAIVATALLWFWTSLGVASELLLTVIPTAFGWAPLINAALARTLFAITLHGIVYFWLMPAYIAYYTMVPQAAGGRLYSDTLGRLTFILFLVFSLPVGLHHLLADPEHGTAWKFLQSIFTAMVVLPTLLTIFTISASLEIAGRSRGGRGLLGWTKALPWRNPLILAVILSLIMLGLGGFGGVVNMSYAMNSMIHNTQWVTAHFHLIFGGAVIIMYMAIAYEFWPKLTGRRLASPLVARAQLVLWFVGMIVLTIPWHITGLMGMPRRYASYDYSDPFYGRMSWLVVFSVAGGAILLISVFLLIGNLIATHWAERSEDQQFRWALSVSPPERVPSVLNSFALWNVLVAAMMLVGYGYPIAALVVAPAPSAVGVPVTADGE